MNVVVKITVIMVNVVRIIPQKGVIYMVQHLNTRVQHPQHVTLTIQQILIWRYFMNILFRLISS